MCDNGLNFSPIILPNQLLCKEYGTICAIINGFAVDSPVVGLDEVVLEDVQVVARRKVAPVTPTKKKQF